MKFHIRWEHNGEQGEGQMVFKDVDVRPVLDWQEETSALAMQLDRLEIVVKANIAENAELKEDVRKLKFKKFDAIMGIKDAKKKSTKKKSSSPRKEDS